MGWYNREDYERLMKDVKSLKAMTDTAAWQKLYRHIRTDLQLHKDELLTATKTEDVTFHQIAIKELTWIIGDVLQAPIIKLKRYFEDDHQSSMKTAEWNEALGKVEIKSL